MHRFLKEAAYRLLVNRQNILNNMANITEDALAAFKKSVKEQGDLLRRLKEENRPKVEITEAVSELRARKKKLEDKERELAPPKEAFNRASLEDLIKRRFFFSIAFGIYGGVAGLYDYGPMGCSMKSNLLKVWRQHFILQENLLEIDTPCLTPKTVLKASGHMEKFADVMVKDTQTGECFRADHLIKDYFEAELAKPKLADEKKAEYKSIIARLEGFSKDDIGCVIKKYNICNPLTKVPVSEPLDFNLMFGTSIGPGGNVSGFLRPETAQGIFVNFKKLLEFNNGRLPFGAASVGRAFRNEISPRSGLLRVREFDLAEIEYFVHPDRKDNFDKFCNVADLTPFLYSQDIQLSGEPPLKITLREAVEKGIIANETIGYFIGRIYLFLLRVGVNPAKVRFRQHLSTEMAHYACDCWDAECSTSFGWVECVGCADRACFDISRHQEATGVDLVAQQPLREPKKIDVIEVSPDKKVLGKKFRKEAQAIMEALKNLKSVDIEVMEDELQNKGSYILKLPDTEYTLEPHMVNVLRSKKTIYVREFQPSVIEPSFGIGRILYAVLEHSFRVRPDDEQRTWLALPSAIAPVACSVLPLSNNPEFTPFIQTLSTSLTENGVSHKVDDSSGSIGRRYARTDEIAIPFGITVDFDTIKAGTATLRERDTTKQIRAKLEELPALVAKLSNGDLTWQEVIKEYPEFTGQESMTTK